MPGTHRFRSCARAAVVAAFSALALFVQGCSMGFTAFKPGENAALYAPLFAGALEGHDADCWLWVRGTAKGDLDGDGVANEEFVLATVQRGNERNPGPVEAAHLAAVDVDGEGRRVVVARHVLFDADADPVAGAPKPANSLLVANDRPFTRCRMQMVRDKLTLTETVVVSFWSEPTPSAAWYAGFVLTEDGLRKNLETAMRQSMPGVLVANLDKRIESSRYGYQLLFGVAAIPEEIAAKLGPPDEAPLWGHVFERNGGVGDGEYVQADRRFGDDYRSRLAPGWNQAYLKAVLKGLPPDELAWLEYHLALLNHYAGDDDTARRFLDRAAAGAGDPALRSAIENAADALAL